MSEHDIQSEPRLPSPLLCEEEPLDSLDIRRSWTSDPRHWTVIGISWQLCLVGAAGSLLLLGIVAFHGRKGLEFFVANGIWDSLPYVFVAVLIWQHRHSFAASLLMLVATTILTGYGLYELYDGLSSSFEPIPPGAMCCDPLEVQFDVPLIQGVFIVVFAGLAAGCGWIENRGVRS